MQITEYSNKTAFKVAAKQSNGSIIEVAPNEKAKAKEGTCFTAIKYPEISSRWYKLHIERIRNY
jgi:hypothetical protein